MYYNEFDLCYEVPKIPRFAPKNGKKACIFSNQVCKVKADKYLKFPGTKERLNIGKLGMVGGLQQVRMIPKYGEYVVELVTQQPDLPEREEKAPQCVMGIDLGVNCLATLVDNTGSAPVIIKGKAVKNINQYYNKQRAYYYGILHQGLDTKQGPFTSKRLNRLDRLRSHKIKDFFHKASCRIVQLAVDREIDTILIGQNVGWKQEIQMGKTNKQTFVFIPHHLLIRMITYKAERSGITVITHEESFTSKASFLDGDPIPDYGKRRRK